MSHDEQKPCREKYWNESMQTEQLEALRDMVCYLVRKVKDLEQKAYEMSLHQHLPTGLVSVPLDWHRDIFSPGARIPNRLQITTDPDNNI